MSGKFRDGVAWYAKYLASKHWKEVRDRALSFAEYRCQVCNSDKSLDVHHRTYENIGREPIQDLTVLCKECHALFHKGTTRRKQIVLGIPTCCRQVSRSDVIKKSHCPECGASPGGECISKRGTPRKSAHRARWNRFIEQRLLDFGPGAFCFAQGAGFP